MAERSSYWGGQRMNRKTVLLICLMACAVFCILYGPGKLNPGYTDWLLTNPDSVTQYIGVQAFRQSKWMFPLGNLNTIHYPDTSSIIFTDSIPLLAIIYKLLLPLFSGNYQFIGIWVLLCYILTGLISGKILSRFIKNEVTLLIGVAIILLNPVLAYRYFGHASLMGQWTILLAAIPLTYYSQWPSGSRKMLGFSCFLGFLTPSIHMYFFLEAGVVLFTYCLYDALTKKKFIAEIGNLALYCLSGAITIFLLGGFSGTRKLWGGAGGFGEYSFNLNGFLNAQGYSTIFNGLTCGEKQYEGFSYLGIGIILLLLTVVISAFTLEKNGTWIRNKRNLIITFVVFAFISVLISTSPVVMLGDHVLFKIPFPRIIQRIWGVFRSTGRLIWPLYYFLYFAGIILIEKYIKRKKLIPVILFACLILQVVDLYPLFSGKKVSDGIVYQSGLDEETWTELVQETGTEHLVLMGMSTDSQYEFGIFAINHGLTLNTFRMAHGELPYLERAEKSIKNKEKGYLYIFSDENESEKYSELKSFKMDSYWLGLPVEDPN